MQWGQRRTGSAGTERAYGGRVPVLLWAVVLLLEGCQEARPTFSASELHPADSLSPWQVGPDSLATVAYRWFDALDQGDFLAMSTLLADSVRLPSVEPNGAFLHRDSLIRQRYHLYQAGERTRTEPISTWAFRNPADNSLGLGAYFKQRFVSPGAGWQGRRGLAVWTLDAKGIRSWQVWYQDWLVDRTDGSLAYTFESPKVLAPGKPELRQRVNALEKRFAVSYIGDASRFWSDTARYRDENGLIWQGDPRAIASKLATSSHQAPGVDSVVRKLDRVEILVLPQTDLEFGLAFGTEWRYRGGHASICSTHRVYTFHHQRIVYAEQYLSPLRISR